MSPLNTASIAEVRDELLQAAKAAATDAHPLRWAVFGHFANRIERLAEDHQRLSTQQEQQWASRETLCHRMGIALSSSLPFIRRTSVTKSAISGML